MLPYFILDRGLFKGPTAGTVRDSLCVLFEVLRPVGRVEALCNRNGSVLIHGRYILLGRTELETIKIFLDYSHRGSC